jgi:hypothetical protein
VKWGELLRHALYFALAVLAGTALLVVLLALFGCASQHFIAGDALVCEQGGEYRESASGVVVSCEQGLRWTGPMSDNAANATLGIIKGALDAAPIP